MFPQSTPEDRLLLEKYRLERLCSLFNDTLNHCFLQVAPDNSLLIHCSEPWIVDQLLSEIDRLRCYSWLVMGADLLLIYVAHEEIYRSPTHKLVQKLQNYLN